MDNLKECLKFLFCAGGGYTVPILIDVSGIMKVGEGLALVMIFTVSVGLMILLEYLEGLIAYFKMDREEIEQLHTRKLGHKIDLYLKITVGIGFPLGREPINEVKYKECCKLINQLCKDNYVKIEDKKVFYNMLCELWTKYGMDKGIYTIPPEIQKKWKKAQAEDKLRQLKKDF